MVYYRGDMTVRTCAAATASLLGAVWGCGTTNETPATVNAVTPHMAFNDAPTPATIEGDGFRPAYRFDTMGGAASSEAAGFSATLVPSAESTASVSVPLEGIAWRSMTELAATIPAAVPAGLYDVVVVDPRGGERRLPAGFTSLGPDVERPAVTIDTPGPRSLIGDGATITVHLTADDGLGFVASLTATVTHGELTQSFPCDLPPTPGQVTCEFQFIAPAPVSDTDSVTIEARAADRAGNEADPAWRHSPLARRPSLDNVSPQVGPAGGNTPIVLRGANFVRPTPEFDGSLLLLDGRPVEAEVVNDTTIAATTPAHYGGVARLAVSTGGAETTELPFEFIDPLQLKRICPDRGRVSGGTPVTIVGNGFRGLKTIITIDGNELVSPDPIGSTRIEGVTPPGRGPGPVYVLATDEHGRSNMLIFTYLEADAPDGGGDPSICPQGPT
jgi:hypothetical protein